MRNRNRNANLQGAGGKERGVYVIKFALFLGVFISFCALIIGMGLTVTNHAKLQDTANLAALGALNEFIRSGTALHEDGTAYTYAERATLAVSRANEVLGSNRLYGSLSPAQVSLGSGDGGQLALGTYYPEDPPADCESCKNAACNDTYPCFVEHQEGGTAQGSDLNGVHIVVKSPPASVPFAGVFGSGTLAHSVSASAYVQERCVAFVVNISGVSALATHSPSDDNVWNRASYAYNARVADTGCGGCTVPAEDRVTRGNWRGKYGREGFYIPADATVLPPYANLTLPDNGRFLQNAVATRALQTSSGSGRLLSWTGTGSTDPFNIDVEITDGRSHDVSLYFTDADRFANYTQTIETIDLATGATLETRDVSNFGEGKYVTWTVSGRTRFRISSALRAGVNGVFFGTPPPVGSLTCGDPELTSWCNLCDLRSNPDGLQCTHFKSDYSRQKTLAGDRLIDAYTDPEPLTGILRSVNAGLRMMEQQGTPGDRVALLTYAGALEDAVPNVPATSTDNKLTYDLGRLIDLTNYTRGPEVDVNGIQIRAPRFPNFIDHHWFPVAGSLSAQSNIEEAFDQAIARLSDPNSCPARSDKIIILFTGRRMNCVQKRYDKGDPRWNFPDGQDRVCGTSQMGIGSYDSGSPYDATFESLRIQLLGPMYSIPFEKSVLGELRANRIRAYTVIADYDGVTNFLNLKNPATGEFYDFLSAAAAGYRGVGEPWWAGIPGTVKQSFVYASATDARVPQCPMQAWNEPDAFYCEGLGDAESGKFVFRTSLAVLYDLAMLSGGAPCPLLPSPVDHSGLPDTFCTESNYDAYGNYLDGTREEAGQQLCALKNITRSEQAAQCVQSAIAGNPYALTSVKKLVLN
jgi:hypothetical protein